MFAAEFDALAASLAEGWPSGASWGATSPSDGHHTLRLVCPAVLRRLLADSSERGALSTAPGGANTVRGAKHTLPLVFGANLPRIAALKAE